MLVSHLTGEKSTYHRMNDYEKNWTKWLNKALLFTYFYDTSFKFGGLDLKA